MSDTGYTVILSNGTVLGGGNYEVPDISNTTSSLGNSIVDASKTSLGLLRRGGKGYAEEVSENFVHLLENFAFGTAPVNPIAGQLWWDTAHQVLKVYNGSSFSPAAGSGLANGLASSVTIALQDSVTHAPMGSTLFNGSTDVIIPVTLVDSGVIPGTYVAPQMVIDSKGRIVSATSTSVGAGGITGALGYVPANDANVVHKTGDTMTGSLVIASADINVTGTGRHRQDGNELLPRGVITMWTGSTAPAGWALCDGTNSTPNLSGRFIVGIGGGYTIGVTGGNNFLTATSDSQLGTINGGGSTDTQGSHSHFGQTGDHTLSVNEMPSHNHVVSANVDNLGSPYTFTGINGNLRIADAGTTYSGGNQPHNHPINTDGAHAHNISVSFNAAHAHSTSWDNRAAYYALAYIMKL